MALEKVKITIFKLVNTVVFIYYQLFTKLVQFFNPKIFFHFILFLKLKHENEQLVNRF